MAELAFRDFVDDDFEWVADLLASTWYPGPDPVENLWLARDELAYHLERSTQATLCEVAGERRGVIMLCDGAPERSERWAAARDAIARRAREADGVDVSRGWSILDDDTRVMDEMAERHGIDDVGVFQLLAVAPQARGMGVGSALLSYGASWFADRGAVRVRLVTDDGCDWRAYEHLGMRRALEVPSTADGDFSIYVYEDDREHLARETSRRASR